MVCYLKFLTLKPCFSVKFVKIINAIPAIEAWLKW